MRCFAMNLIDCEYDLEYSEFIRVGKNGDEETMHTDWYFNRDFTDAELLLLIDNLEEPGKINEDTGLSLSGVALLLALQKHHQAFDKQRWTSRR